MQQQKKFIATGLLLLTILIVIFLASGISNVEFQPAIIDSNHKEVIEQVPFDIPGFSNTNWFYILLCMIWVAMPVSIILFIKSPEYRKRMLQSILYIATYGLIIFLLGRKSQDIPPELDEIENDLIESTIMDMQRKASDLFSSAANEDPNINFILELAILLFLGILIWFLLRHFFFKPISITEQLKGEAEGAINEIQSGVDLRNVIIRCYMDMCQILADRRGIQREQTMTPREFELELQKLGFPQSAIQRLTRLFELVRYGNDQLDFAAEQEAIHCLTTIADSC